jgi:hypothetical protein
MKLGTYGFRRYSESLELERDWACFFALELLPKLNEGFLIAGIIVLGCLYLLARASVSSFGFVAILDLYLF